MGAAFLAPGEAFVDAVAVRLVGNDEDAAVGGSGRGGKQEDAGKSAEESRMEGTGRMKKPPSGIGPKC